jgi:hypothetical protein
MKIIVSILAILVALAAALAVVVITRQGRPWPHCTSEVVIIKGPDGAPVECVCLGGVLSTCFDPGP